MTRRPRRADKKAAQAKPVQWSVDIMRAELSWVGSVEARDDIEAREKALNSLISGRRISCGSASGGNSRPPLPSPTDPPPSRSYYGDEYSRRCLPEEDGHLGRYTCEYRN